MDAVLEGERESAGIVDRLVGCLQPVLTILGKADQKLPKPGLLIICYYKFIHLLLCFCIIQY